MGQTKKSLAVALLLAGALLGACGRNQGNNQAAAPGAEQSATPTQVSITAKDFAFDVPATFKGGLVNFSFTNSGKEPHFASFARIADGKTAADVKASLTAPESAPPPAGPPPFEDVIAFPTADPGVTGKMTGNLPAGKYVLYCAISSPDGAPHAAKGMLTEVTVTEGPPGELPASVGTLEAVDFALAPLPALKAGSNVVGLSNKGKQLHELNLIELAPGKKIEDAVAWFGQEAGPPPMRFLSGVAVKPGTQGVTELDLKSGSTYAFVCAIPDFLGDFKPHITKGMFTPAFTVS